MTNDLTAIRAQYSDGEYLDAYPRESCATILYLCDETERLRAENERLREALTVIAEWAETADSYEAIRGRARTASIARAALGQEGGV